MATITSTPFFDYDPIIEQLYNEYMSQYGNGSCFGKDRLAMHLSIELNNFGFLGSQKFAFISSSNFIGCEAPSVVAAPFITMVARNMIDLGVKGRQEMPDPARLYCSGQISITTTHLSVGDLKILTNPQNGFICAKKLTLIKHKDEEPESFDVVKSWVINDDTDVETIRC